MATEKLAIWLDSNDTLLAIKAQKMPTSSSGGSAASDAAVHEFLILRQGAHRYGFMSWSVRLTSIRASAPLGVYSTAMNAAEHHRPLGPRDGAMSPTAVAARSGPELSVIVPTFNERDNIAELIGCLAACLGDRSWEVVFVDDDSPDGTADLVRQHAAADSRVRCVRRIGRRGLSSACIEGMLATTADYLAVIDADLQHDERLLPQMLDILKQGETDIVVGSRYAPGGDIGDWDARRARMSRLAVRLSRLVVPAELTDPMSGFFMMRRSVLDGTVHNLSAIGFKILTDLFASHRRAAALHRTRL